MRRLEEEQHEALVFFFYSLKERRNKETRKKKKNKETLYTSFSSFYMRGGLHKVYEFAMSLDIKRERNLHYFFHVCEIEYAGPLQ